MTTWNCLPLAAAALVAPCLPATAAAPAGWPAYGGNPAGTRFSDAAQITPSSVDELRRQWTYRTGDSARRAPALMKTVKFQATPILLL